MKLHNLFVPDMFQSYYLFKKKFVGIHATTSHIYVSVVEAKGYTRKLTSYTSYALEDNEEDHTKQIVTTLKTIKKELRSYDVLISTISGSTIVFKELTLPFITREKIALVLPFEIESHLPFAVADAVIDFTITSINHHEKKSTIIVAAALKKTIEEHLEPYARAGFSPSHITVDIISLFYLTQHFGTHDANVALVGFDDKTTSVAYCPHRTLKAIRTLEHGRITHSVDKAIEFTINMFEETYGTVSHIVAAGSITADHLKVLETETGDTYVHLTTHEKDNQNPKISFMGDLPQTPGIFSLAAAVPTEESITFNLLPQETKFEQASNLFKKQIIVATALTLLIVGSLVTHTVLKIRTLNTITNTVRTETLKELKKRFPTIKTTNISTALKTVQKEVTAQQELWSAFSGSTDAYLYYLATLSASIDRDSLGLTLNKMIITKNTITLEGKVQSFEALEALEKRLKESDLFVKIPDLQKTDFSLLLTLKSQGDAS